jgi:hypothetical protein
MPKTPTAALKAATMTDAGAISMPETAIGTIGTPAFIERRIHVYRT